MPRLREKLRQRGLLVSDGAWGTQLQAFGLPTGHCPEEWNISQPDRVRSVAAAYAEAGADLVLTNTFGGNRLKLQKFGMGGRVGELNAAGASLSLEAAQALGALGAAGDPGPDAPVVAASMGPTGEFLEPYGDLSETEMEEIFLEQALALAAGGARVICVETMTAIEEACCAVRAAKKAAPGMEVIATMTFDPGPAGYATMMGVTCGRAADALALAGADVVGANCGNGMDHMIQVAALLKKATGLPILIHANAGVPELVDGQTVFRESPREMADKAEALVEAGARIVGGCCGTTPAHIKAFRAVMDGLRNK